MRALAHRQELVDLYGGADIFVLASRQHRRPGPAGEGFGIVLAEAALAGLPVMAPANDGSRDAFVPGLTGMRPVDQSVEASPILSYGWPTIPERRTGWGGVPGCGPNKRSSQERTRPGSDPSCGDMAGIRNGWDSNFLGHPALARVAAMPGFRARRDDRARIRATVRWPAFATAVVLTLNEQRNIKRCLASLSWADEVVVVDSGSGDETVALALASGARVVEHCQPGPFLIADQRNWALQHAGLAGEWVLFVDADEEVTQTWRERSDPAVPGLGGPDAYQLAPKYMFWGRWMRRCMRYPAWHDRLVRRGKVAFAGGVWEHFTAGVGMARIDQPYIHHGNSQGSRRGWRGTTATRPGRRSQWSHISLADAGSFRTSRRVTERKVAAHAWSGRPLLRFSLCTFSAADSWTARRPWCSACGTPCTST